MGLLLKDSCEILVNGSGILNTWSYPDIPGVHDYEGKLIHSAHWDQSYDLTGKTVAVIGGRSSAVQIIPNIQPIAKKAGTVPAVACLSNHWFRSTVCWSVCWSKQDQFQILRGTKEEIREIQFILQPIEPQASGPRFGKFVYSPVR